MKTSKLIWVTLALTALLTGCDDFALFQDKQTGRLCWTLDRGSLTKAVEEMPDTNDFILTVRDAKGNTLYHGAYGNSPQWLDMEEGYYSVSIVSRQFSAPAFSQPQYGDEQAVKVPAGGNVTVQLKCTLQNAGLRLKTGPDFLTAYPDGILYVKQENTKLAYTYRENRIAYVKPGDASVLLLQGEDYETLFTRSLAAREILTVTISAPSQGSGGKSSITVQTDTTKHWQDERFVIGGSDSGQNGRYSVGDARKHIGEKDVWVSGYIVGGDLTSNGKNVKTEGITKNTHLALADRSSVTDKASCLAVELPAGKVRETLNLVDHPELIGKRVSVKGDLVEKYFGTLGMKSTKDCEVR